ncbi:MAG: hypothetical protein HC860_15180 [Alkalinema sp. RU_4_3]|nr:hypothetical protein [Alkalinema sp. RU_4_3]
MLTHYRRPVFFSMTSLDMPVWSNVETVATLYKRDAQRFHLLLTEPKVDDAPILTPAGSGMDLDSSGTPSAKSRLVWLEMSPNRVTMTMQGNGNYSYRHLWERGTYGVSRYWLQGDTLGQSHQLQLRNSTMKLEMEGSPLPKMLHVDYELWSGDTNLGHYMMHLEIQH